MFRDYPSLLARGSDSYDSDHNSPGEPAASEPNTQPTYTTVGSIYNPYATNSIQPPTRRPRTRRPPHSQPLSGESAFGFPISLLSALPLNERVSSSPPTTANSLRQYCPLQQNYDRAVNPEIDQERAIFERFRMSVPSIRSGNLPAPPAPPAPPAVGLGITLGDMPADANNGDNDSVTPDEMATLANLPIKTISSLASFPNPNQKAARATLARARAFTPGLGRPDTPSSVSYMSSDKGRDRFPSTFSRAASTSNGTPQPLTAGPPGQRQFKPSTFEAAIRTLGLAEEEKGPYGQSRGSGSKPIPACIPLYPPTSTNQHLPTRNDELTGSNKQLSMKDRMSLLKKTIFGTKSPPKATSSNAAASIKAASVTNSQEDMELRPLTYDTLPEERVRRYYWRGLPSDFGRHKLEAEDQTSMFPRRQEKASGKQSPDLVAERKSKINRNFYAGTEGLGKDIHRVLRDHNLEKDGKAGVIGQERHLTPTGDDGKFQPPYMSIEEASKIENRDHAEPLLSMAFATLLSYKVDNKSGQKAWRSGFTEPDPAWIDKSKKGNRSFFGNGKKKRIHVRKRKLFKKVRRGY
ncbi:hypothetical protein B0T17DRAFT_630698 [Bombardia bombarda]|uniref:Uncharacterized protein n=1 Tax=Bombardia bombarda TaxID=252184 RepID=A0AA39U263_9PEZI|nr:hypothetical protein B0T17DRAFT_630698 [Bombardia bombarda]